MQNFSSCTIREGDQRGVCEYVTETFHIYLSSSPISPVVSSQTYMRNEIASMKQGETGMRNTPQDVDGGWKE